MLNDVLQLIANVINEPVEELDAESGPDTLASWDSLAHVSLIAAVEQTYRIKLTMQEMLAIKTVADLLQVLKKHGAQGAD